MIPQKALELYSVQMQQKMQLMVLIRLKTQQENLNYFSKVSAQVLRIVYQMKIFHV